MTNGIPVCIECGGPTNELNEDEHGEPCPACSERLLETLPGVFHSPWAQGVHSEGSSNEPGVESDDAVDGAVDEEAPTPHSPSSTSRRVDPGVTGSFDDPREPA